MEITNILGFDLLLKFDFLNPWSFSRIYEYNLAFFNGIYFFTFRLTKLQIQKILRLFSHVQIR